MNARTSLRGEGLLLLVGLGFVPRNGLSASVRGAKKVGPHPALNGAASGTCGLWAHIH